MGYDMLDGIVVVVGMLIEVCFGMGESGIVGILKWMVVEGMFVENGFFKLCIDWGVGWVYYYDIEKIVVDNMVVVKCLFDYWCD